MLIPHPILVSHKRDILNSHLNLATETTIRADSEPCMAGRRKLLPTINIDSINVEMQCADNGCWGGLTQWEKTPSFFSNLEKSLSSLQTLLSPPPPSLPPPPPPLYFWAAQDLTLTTKILWYDLECGELPCVRSHVLGIFVLWNSVWYQANLCFLFNFFLLQQLGWLRHSYSWSFVLL